MYRSLTDDDDATMAEWDVFHIKPPQGVSGNCDACLKGAEVVMKIVTYVVVFVGVLLLSMVSNGALLLAASNLRPTENYDVTTRNNSLVCDRSATDDWKWYVQTANE